MSEFGKALGAKLAIRSIMGKNKDRSKAHTARVKHTLWNKGGQLANLLIDIVSAASLDCVVALTAPSPLFVCNQRPKKDSPSLILHGEA